MQWLITLETDSDPITTCRLMNIFRRKGLKLVTLAIGSRPDGYALMAVVESPGTDMDHIFNFLRSQGGVRNVTSYRHEPTENASFVFVDEGVESRGAARILSAFPGSRLIFASHGKYLLEVPAESRPHTVPVTEPGFLPFALVKSSRNLVAPELVGTHVC
jgi:hypothetical protein